MAEPKSLRDKLRRKTIGTTRKVASEILEFGGDPYEIRQTSVGVRGELMEQARVEGNTLNMAEFFIRATIACTYIPGTDDRVFEDADYDRLKDEPVGSFVDEFGMKAMLLLNITQEEMAGNSDATQNSD